MNTQDLGQVNSTLPKVKNSPARRYTGNGTAPALKGRVTALRSVGRSKASIAKELGMSRNTVKAIVDQSMIDQSVTDVMVSSIVPKAFDTVSYAIETKRDGNLAMRFLEATVLTDRGKNTTQTFNVAVGLLAPTQAAAKAPPASTSGPVQEQNLLVSDNKSPVSNNLASGVDVVDPARIIDVEVEDGDRGSRGDE